jgi:predicted dehydrogenase
MPARKQITIGVIGCGHWGPNHIRSFSSIPQSRVVAAADPDKRRLQELKKTYPTVHFSEDYRDVVRNKSIDAIVIATPTSLHTKIARAALEAGKHVLVEKPLCTSASEGDSLVRLARKNRRVLMVGQVFLFNNGILKLKELLDFGDLGKIYYIGSTRTNLGPIRQDVNAVFDLASHDISIFNFLLGSRPSEVSAVGQAFLQEGVEDLAFISMRYPNKVIGRIHVSWLDPRKVREITIVGDRKMVTWDDLAIVGPVQIYDKGVIREPYYEDYGHFHLLAREGDVVIPRVKQEEPLKNQSRHFLAAIERGKIEISNGEDGLNVVRVLEAVQESLAKGGAPVKVRVS